MDESLEEPENMDYDTIHIGGRLRLHSPTTITPDQGTATHDLLMPRRFNNTRDTEQSHNYAWQQHRYTPNPQYPHDERDDNSNIPYTLQEPCIPTEDDFGTTWSFSNHIFEGGED